MQKNNKPISNQYLKKSFIMKNILCLLLICGVIGFYGVTDAKEPREIAKQVFPSVVMLVMEDSNGQPLSLGSGFFVRDDIIATNLHVIEGAAGGYVKIVGKKEKYNITGYVAIDNKMDLVLLKVKDVTAPSITLGDSSKVAIGDEVFAIGNPKGLEGTFSKGIISGIRNIEEDTLLQITAPISPGSSGGPVLNNEGNVIGVSVATFEGGQNLNFSIPSSYVSKLLSDMKQVIKLAEKEKPKKKEKSILANLGGRNTEGIVGEKLTWDNQLYGHDGSFSYTLRNQLRESVKNIYCLIVFYDKDGNPLDITVTNYPGIIPGRLAKRINGSVDQSIKQLTTPVSKDNEYLSSLTPSAMVEFRILNFEIVEDSEGEI